MEWSRPRQTAMAGRRKATEEYCPDCSAWHRTQRHALGEQRCPFKPTALEALARPLGPLIRTDRPPRTAGMA